MKLSRIRLEYDGLTANQLAKFEEKAYAIVGREPGKGSVSVEPKVSRISQDGTEFSVTVTYVPGRFLAASDFLKILVEKKENWEQT